MNNAISHYARVIIANHLHEKLPHLVVVVHPHAVGSMKILFIKNGKR